MCVCVLHAYWWAIWGDNGSQGMRKTACASAAKKEKRQSNVNHVLTMFFFVFERTMFKLHTGLPLCDFRDTDWLGWIHFRLISANQLFKEEVLVYVILFVFSSAKRDFDGQVWHGLEWPANAIFWDLSDLNQGYLITSPTRVKRVSRIHHRTILKRVWPTARWLSTAWFKSDKISKEDYSGWRPAIALLYLFLFHSLLRLTSFLSRYKINDILPFCFYPL